MPNSSTAFNDTLEYLYSRLPVFQLQGKAALNYKLDKTLEFLAHLGNPHQKLKFVHVGGTNGKGSVSHMLASILQEAGYKVGLYTSPHLKSFTERVKINGEEVSKDFVVNWVNEQKSYIETLKPSFFEATVALSLDYFCREEVDVVVLEVGMGGRLDSTNVVTPEVSVITNISFDHAQYLGDTLEKIAFEKAGIIKDGIPVVIGEKQEEISHVFLTAATSKHAELILADETVDDVPSSDLKGIYQQKNIKTVLATVKVLEQLGWKLSLEAVTNGLLKTTKNTSFKGRWQILSEHPKIVCDTGHNEAGISLLLKQIEKEAAGQVYFVLGFVKEKEVEKIVKMLPKNGKYYFCGGENTRLASPEELLALAERNGLKADAVKNVNEGINLAKENADEHDFIFVGGSTFVVAEINEL